MPVAQWNKNKKQQHNIMKYFSDLFQENRAWHLMQIGS